MKVHLLYKDQDYSAMHSLPWNEKELIQDLNLNILFDAMANGDEYFFNTAKNVVFFGLRNVDEVIYRQNILKDCLKNPAIVREIYQIPIESIENKKKRWLGIYSRNASGVLSSSIRMLEMFMVLLKRLRSIADTYSNKFESEGFVSFFSMVKKELNDEFFAVVDDQLVALRFRRGVQLSAKLGDGNEGTDYMIRKPLKNSPNWARRVFEWSSPKYTFIIDERDDAGARALAEIQDRGIDSVANALAKSADHIDSFFTALRFELAFYLGCVNLFDCITQTGNPITFPQPKPIDNRRHSFSELYDICLALSMKQKIVGSEVDGDNKDVFIITGANQGGKSTFLRSIGLAQLMMESGMFVPAEKFNANLSGGVITHFKREEDISMTSGKLDEELNRMSKIADHISSNALLLFNESFAATNEREGSEIARQITRALMQKRIKVFFVTHLYDFAHGLYSQHYENVIPLRAERLPNGDRTYRIIEGEPLQTSFGKDVYVQVFGEKM